MDLCKRYRNIRLQLWICRSLSIFLFSLSVYRWMLRLRNWTQLSISSKLSCTKWHALLYWIYLELHMSWSNLHRKFIDRLWTKMQRILDIQTYLAEDLLWYSTLTRLIIAQVFRESPRKSRRSWSVNP